MAQTDPNTEYRSVILTVDHTTKIAPHTVQKVVLSTETLEEAAIALIKYYQEDALLTSVETIKQFQEIGRAEFPALVYVTAENIQIILSTETHAQLWKRSETLLDCHNFILSTVNDIITSCAAEGSDIAPLWAFDWSTTQPEFEADKPAEEA